jgi:uncharacterized protein
MPMHNAPIEPHAYRQFWPWFLFGLPGLVVIASFITLGIALRHSDSPVRDSYVKHGLAIERTQTRDHAAVQQHLRALLSVDAASGQIMVTLRGQLHTTPDLITMQFIHPFDAMRDFSSALRRDADGVYRSIAAQKFSGRWTVELAGPASDRWQLRSDINLSRANVFELQP